MSIRRKTRRAEVTALDHGSARLQAYRHHQTKIVRGSGSIAGHSGASPHQIGHATYSPESQDL
ncbi:MAG TPA: hypothetical protein VGH55_06215, partial [Chthoniobacterales bacterium]